MNRILLIDADWKAVIRFVRNGDSDADGTGNERNGCSGQRRHARGIRAQKPDHHRYHAEYTLRNVKKQSRLSPAFLQSNGGSETGFTLSDIRGGGSFRAENYRLSINAGVSNLFNRYYFEQFVYAPARGRSFTLGTTWEIF